MRKRIVGTTVAVAAGLALSGCAAGGAGLSAPVGGGQEQQPVQNQQVSAESADSQAGDDLRPCLAGDLKATFSSHEQPGEFASSGSVGVTKTSENMTPCVLDGRAAVELMRGSEGGDRLPVSVEQVPDDGHGVVRPMVLDAVGDLATFRMSWTSTPGCDTPGAVSVTPPAGGDAVEVPVNRGEDSKMDVCDGAVLRVVPFGDYTS
ncbi:DUF4232 domain-containing protein [Saccharopolyspora erythraea]|uniref:DUF4232 domain-containing protein n=1 Tax=Saccharopolyspora erythraea TaxID=1836 RepID=UPI001BA617F0|nr:DUF4232 domain-containing protein [Saccharopolyspora erythraea]QUH00947.1 DUF4232 domain-containing protein [Saccharopolyspora erythraea]